MLLLVWLWIRQMKTTNRRMRRFKTRPVFRKRKALGEMHLFSEFYMHDSEIFHKSFRMTTEQFDRLLSMCCPSTGIRHRTRRVAFGHIGCCMLKIYRATVYATYASLRIGGRGVGSRRMGEGRRICMFGIMVIFTPHGTLIGRSVSTAHHRTPIRSMNERLINILSI